MTFINIGLQIHLAELITGSFIPWKSYVEHLLCLIEVKGVPLLEILSSQKEELLLKGGRQ